MSQQTSKHNKNSPEQYALDTYFMVTATLAASRSKDPCTHVGACIVDDKGTIVGIGYNDMPKGCHNLPWKKNNEEEDKLQTKKYYVCYAVMNAVMNKTVPSLEGCRVYVTSFPSNECAKIIIQSGIKEVIYKSDERSHKCRIKAAKILFNHAGVNYRLFPVKKRKITELFDFSENDSDGEEHPPQKKTCRKKSLPMKRNNNKIKKEK